MRKFLNSHPIITLLIVATIVDGVVDIAKIFNQSKVEISTNDDDDSFIDEEIENE